MKHLPLRVEMTTPVVAAGDKVTAHLVVVGQLDPGRLWVRLLHGGHPFGTGSRPLDLHRPFRAGERIPVAMTLPMWAPLTVVTPGASARWEFSVSDSMDGTDGRSADFQVDAPPPTVPIEERLAPAHRRALAEARQPTPLDPVATVVLIVGAAILIWLLAETLAMLLAGSATAMLALGAALSLTKPLAWSARQTGGPLQRLFEPRFEASIAVRAGESVAVAWRRASWAEVGERPVVVGLRRRTLSGAGERQVDWQAWFDASTPTGIAHLEVPADAVPTRYVGRGAIGSTWWEVVLHCRRTQRDLAVLEVAVVGDGGVIGAFDAIVDAPPAATLESLLKGGAERAD